MLASIAATFSITNISVSTQITRQPGIAAQIYASANVNLLIEMKQNDRPRHHKRAGFCLKLRLQTGVQRVFKRAQPRARGLHQNRHIARFVLVVAHQHMGRRNFRPGEHF